VSEICYGKLAKDHRENHAMESNNLPLPLAGEGWGEGGFGIISPSPLSSPQWRGD
jgi:hypothetical protein